MCTTRNSGASTPYAQSVLKYYWMVVASDPVKNYPEICDNACAPCQLNLLNFMGPLSGPVHATVCSGWIPTDHTLLQNIQTWNVIIATIHRKKAKNNGSGVVERQAQERYEAVWRSICNSKIENTFSSTQRDRKRSGMGADAERRPCMNPGNIEYWYIFDSMFFEAHAETD